VLGAIAVAAVGLGLFQEVPAATSGIRWVHVNGFSAERYLPETVGAGCAFLDYDNDGWMDVYLVNSGPTDFWKPAPPPRNALYRNNHDGTFADVTRKAGVGGGTYGMGAAAADFDNDGDPDLLVTGYGSVILYRNGGDGTFADVTRTAGLAAATGWSTSAAWLDADGDGDLDLFVGRYVAYGGDSYVLCGNDGKGRRRYCIPKLFKPTTSLLYENRGDGTFREIGAGAAIGKVAGKALGVVAADVDDDGRTDLFVAHDTAPNALFLNGGKGWTEVGLEAGVAFGDSGKARSGMGVDAVDFDQDGREDLFVANIDQEMFSLYKNLDGRTFDDVAGAQGIAQATRFLSGWGLRFFDYDNDGWPDLFLANGHPDDRIAETYTQITHKEPLLLFKNDKGRLRNVSRDGGPAFAKRLSARGLATGDFDNDGRVDVLVTANGGAPVLLRNAAGAGRHWIGVRLAGTRGNRDGVGARLAWSAGGAVRSRQKVGGGSYLSSHDVREVLGLGTAAKLDWVEVRWPAPSLRRERFTGLKLDAYTTLVEGTGTSAP
jgi:enediyne biosynthesis protein E4